MNSSANQVASSPLSVTAGFGVWAPIATAPRDGTKFLAWMRESWIEVMYYDEDGIYYGSDGDSPPHGRSLPQYWMPLPPSPNQNRNTMKSLNEMNEEELRLEQLRANINETNARAKRTEAEAESLRQETERRAKG